MKLFTKFLAAVAIAGGMSLPAYAETTLTVHYPNPGFFKDVMETIAKKFMQENPDIKVRFANPSATYQDGVQLILRQAGTAEMPDLTFIALNNLRMVQERDIPVDLGPFIAKEGDMKGAQICIATEDMGLSDKLLAAAGEGASVAADDSVKLGGYLVLRREQGTVTDRTYDCALKEQQSLFASRNLMTAQEGDSK